MVRCRRGGVRCPVIYDVGEDWIVMEDVGRVSVKDYLKSLPQTSPLPSSAITCLLSLTNSIISIHSSSCIHGDLTTSNFMYNPTSIIPLDFGLSTICAPNMGEKKRKNNEMNGGNNNRIESFAVDLYVLERSIISTHENGEEMVKVIVNEYKEKSREGDRVVQKLGEVRARGRKRECFG
ncbi:hypothetical protein TrST_g2561 [Triparma strigata]|uniref:non-specific serine/threonine protein kinase n=1 Tax=Triparma strigata TaxID=1606541 RepID=A0A9W7AFX6_9STRA|nr:hypothetical protein TrST_g2561 [Triparma strigata]